MRIKEYDRNSATEYAKKWAYLRNPKYYNFDPVGGDCTSFTSQCIYEGSKVMNYDKKNGWYYINGNNLNKLPISGKNIPNILSRSIGINRKIKANSFKNTQDVTTYFINEINNNKYYIPVTLTTDNKGEKIEIIIKELEAKDNIDKNLSTYISAGTILQNYQILENEFNMEFNSLILNGLDNISEEVIYGLALSIKDNYDIDKISIDVNNKQILAYALKNS